jgi:hypothetical protein
MSFFSSLGRGCGAAAGRATGAWFADPAWWHVMEFADGPPRSINDVELRFRRLAARLHPDRGGSAEQMQCLIRAREQARRQLAPRR